ncbi:tyrosine-type recombinase/integrase [Embleya sp. NPDC055664]
MRRGEAFHVLTGPPESEYRAAQAAQAAREAEEGEAAPPTPVVLPGDALWPAFSRAYPGVRWRTLAGKSREGIADGLAAVAIAMVSPDAPGRPAPLDVRAVMRWIVIPDHTPDDLSAELLPVWEWLEKNALPVSALEDPAVAREVRYRVTYKLDGGPAGAETVKRRRRALQGAVAYAREIGALTGDPFAGGWSKLETTMRPIDRRTLPNPTQAQQLLTAVSYVGSWDRMRGRRLVAFFAVMYFAALRPAEVVGLKVADCELPESGWGVLTLWETRPVSGKQWTDSGARHDKRGLKGREPGTDRPVPIPPVLAAILRAHLEEFGTAKDGRVFRNERGELVGTSTYWRVWQEAREFALPPARVRSILAEKPYALRAAAITRWLNAGVPVAEVARRAGNSVEVIHKRYQGCMDGGEEAANRAIERALEEPTT